MTRQTSEIWQIIAVSVVLLSAIFLIVPRIVAAVSRGGPDSPRRRMLVVLGGIGFFALLIGLAVFFFLRIVGVIVGALPSGTWSAAVIVASQSRQSTMKLLEK
jgi:hypothetical protein